MGFDCAGSFSGQPNSVQIKSAADGSALCDPVVIDTGVVTAEDEWRKISIKFEIEKLTCDVKVDGNKLLDDVPFEGITIPKTVCVGVCAATSKEKQNLICVNDLCLEEEGEEIDV